MGAVAFVASLLGYIQTLSSAGRDIAEALEWGKGKVDGFAAGADPTAADWDELNARIAAGTAALNQDPPA